MTSQLLILLVVLLVPVFAHMAEWQAPTVDDDTAEPGPGPLAWDAGEDLADVFVREMNR